MEYRIECDTSTHLIQSTVQGDVSFGGVVDFVAEFILTARDQGCFLFLNDFRGAVPKLSITELHKLPQIIKDVMLSLGYELDQVKRSIVVTQDTDDFRFFSAAIFQSGQAHKLFLDIDEAKEWLLS